MRRGNSLQSPRSKADGSTAGLPSRGSPLSLRHAPNNAVLQADRSRSFSTSDTPNSPALVDTPIVVCFRSADDGEKIERLESSLAQAALAAACSAEGSPEDVGLDPQRARQAVVQLQQKILKLTEQLRVEQAARDENVAEYLKLANNTNDKQQSCRLKQVFEKKNQKSAASIAQLQRKLEHYGRRLREAEQGGTGGAAGRQPRGVLRDVGQGLRGVGARVLTGLSEGVADSVRGGLSSFSHATHSAAGAVASKPRELASLLRNRFGSADNISTLKDGHSEDGMDGGDAVGRSPGARLQGSPRFGSEEDCSSATSGSAGTGSMTGAPGGLPGSRGNTLERGRRSSLEMLVQEVQELRDVQARLDETLEELKSQYQRDYMLVMQALQEDRFKCERLEEQLNDLTELHQNEILNLKQELASMEEKIAYQSNERARDIQEALEACQTRISKMELQQQQQQVVQLEGLENATARTLLGKLINVLLTLMAVVLVFVSTVANCVVPLMKTRNRSFSTLLFLLLFAFLWRNWDTLSGHTQRMLQTPR
ncbi:transmembrane and coiled-coil domains protein 1 isoform X1 [Electrophorus electricus]|uniref:transmembrane and coiled-coil domains protein 1 isoform X1 n=1 Tax=Electrophorus electricus TaxID=8005 RepID=UPI0015D02C54|nr:transmembrane and coiled-coil domains protein 1 isoform X1 [Electrophorus electricus]XP_035392035.1 transmembrane and coiled-coil domains protein 1 isoform X1 [Electrophorus electricus]XP_035392036.1 transmembrane and coiled-coil domains protein 1 isoform X1 [Electrophorus electricus]